MADSDNPDDTNAGSSPASREKKSKSRHKRSKRNKRQKPSGNKPSTTQSEPKVKKSRSSKQQHPLNGMVLSVSTVQSEENKHATYNGVSQICRELGAEVLGQVSKRVQLLICTRGAVNQSSQRVRKAIKKGLPIVDVAWLEKCQSEMTRVDMDPFLLTEEAKQATETRNSRLDSVNNGNNEKPDVENGWSEPISMGCCCVCHENGPGAEMDCKWCRDKPCIK